MRKVVLVALVCALWFGFCVDGSLADGMVLPEALSPGYLVVRYHRVTVDIVDEHAVTRVEQAFYNPNVAPVKGRYLFPVPPEAILSRFEANVDGQQQTVAHQNAAVTNAALYEILAQRQDASLLQYADWESLAFDLSLPPGGSREMILEYKEQLAPSGGLYRYRYVLSTERYSSLPLQEVSLTINLRSSSGLTNVYSPSHAVRTEWRSEGHAQVAWSARDLWPEQDFELFYASSNEGFGGGLLAGQHDERDHFLFLFSPGAEPRREDALSKDIVFVIDRSGSMSGEKIDQARDALSFILGQLNEDDRFSIVSFNHRVLAQAESLQPTGHSSLAGARRYIERLSAEGDTDLEGALQAGLQILASAESRRALPLLVFLTDGLPTAGITDPARIARLVTGANAELGARLHVFGVGYDVNTHLLDRLAAENAGSVTYVQPGESLEAALTGFYDRIAHPVLTDVEISWEGLEVSDLYPRDIPDLFLGSSLSLAGRYRATGGPVVVRVSGIAGGERREYVYRYDLRQSGNHDFVPRLWATRRAGALLDRLRIEGESQSLVAEVRELGLSYGLVTPYTSFVVAGQAEGPASADHNALYRRADLNLAWGQTTIQARVQNQAYQQADQANLAVGANVINSGERSLAQVGSQNVDLALLQGHKGLDEPITEAWLARNVAIDRTVAFGSKEYFALAADPAARAFLQSGVNVTFGYKGSVIAVRGKELRSDDRETATSHVDQQPRSPSLDDHRANLGQSSATMHRSGSAPRICLALGAAIALLGIAAVFAKRVNSSQ